MTAERSKQRYFQVFCYTKTLKLSVDLVSCSLFFSTVVAVILTVLLLKPVHAASADVEIAHLLTELENSGCQFNRNGTIYTDRAAAAHLREKLNHMSSQGHAMAAEPFITGIASRSSMSGQPYFVLCRGIPPVESGTWLMGYLRRYRISNLPPMSGYEKR